VPIHTVLALGNAALTVTAGGTIEISAASNPTMWLQSSGQIGSGGPQSYFSTYGDDTDLTLLSVGGDVNFRNMPLHVHAGTSGWPSASQAYNNLMPMSSFVFYPARTKAVAAAGSITVEGGMVIFPSATGNFDLWAQDSVNLKIGRDTDIGSRNGAVLRTLVMSPSDPALLESILMPHAGRVDLRDILGMPDFADPEGLFELVPSDYPNDPRPKDRLLHETDHEPSRIYANEGDITEFVGKGQYYAEQVRVRAGRDINNIMLRAQNNHASDLSLFHAARDINLGGGRISIDGPGFVIAEAGRDVFLGRGAGIQTVGNGETGQGPGQAPKYANPSLPRKGADLLVLAGTADKPRYDAFIDAYLDPNVSPVHIEYFVSLMSFMRQVTGDPNLSVEAALAEIRNPRFEDHRKILINYVLSRELRAAGRGQLDGLGDEGLGYERGYEAIATLFPGAEQRGNTGWQGDVIMDVSMIRSYLGGDVGIVAPGGYLQVSALSSSATGAANGVLTINGGEINIFTGAGTIINKSRVLTARGGDITIWATFGDIDAGKGRKSSLTTPPSTYQLSLDGSISYQVNPSFTGSGISTQKGTPDAVASDVDLYAPNGTINAGDAGIQVSGNVYLGALFILGADNISAGGEIKGLPPVDAAGALTVEGEGQNGAADAAKDATQNNANEQPSIIIVEVLGFGGGDGDGSPESEEERRRRRSQGSQGQQTYDPNGAVRVLGHGALSESQMQSLTPEERARKGQVAQRAQ
jgi:hypothetical protein